MRYGTSTANAPVGRRAGIRREAVAARRATRVVPRLLTLTLIGLVLVGHARVAGAQGAAAATDAIAASAAAPAAPAAQFVPNQLGLSELAGRAEVSLAGGEGFARGLVRFGRADLSESVRRALENSYELSAAQARAVSASEMVDVALGALRPTLDVRANVGRELSRPGSLIDDATGEPVSQSLHNRGDNTIIARQMLIDFSALSEIDRQRALARSSELVASASRDQIALETANAHINLLRFKLSADFAIDHQQTLERLFDYVNERVSAGGASPAEAERVKARAINARSAVIDATGALESAMVSYRRLVGAVPTVMPTEDRLSAEPLPPLEIAVSQALEQSPTLRSQREAVQAIEDEARSARASIMPKFSLELGSYRSRNAGGRPGWSDDTRAFLVMSLNLLNGGADVARERSILARADEARYRLLDAERRLVEAVTVSYNVLDAVAKRFASVQAEYEANLKVAMAFREQLEEARRPLLDVLDAQERLLASRQEMLRLMLELSTVQLQIHRLIGGMSLAEVADSAGAR